jgi:pimeloyl-ACP methyl ester carboxylesterase
VAILAAACSTNIPTAVPVSTATPTATAASPPPPAPSATPTPAPTAATAESTPGFTPTVTPFDCPGEAASAENIRCSYVTVPEDDDFPAGPTIDIAVAEVDSPFFSDTPVAFLQGGPGGEIVSEIDVFSQLGLSMVLIDQRGTGLSRPNLECPEIDELYPVFSALPSRDDSYESSYRQALSSCRDRLLSEGVNMEAFTTENNADDIAIIREALGYEEWDLWGSSYGSRLALTVLQDHPEGVRSVILDGSFPPQLDFYAGIPAGADRAMTHLFESCAASPSCAAAFGDLEALFETAVQRLDENPAAVRLSRSEFDEPFDYLVDGPALHGLLFEMLYVTPWLADLPFLISRAAQGDVSEIVRRIDEVWAPLAVAMNDAIMCPEEAAYFDVAALSEYLAGRSEPFRVAFDTESVIEDCRIWGLPAAPEAVKLPVTSDVPALVVAGSYDPITPPDFGRMAAATLPNSTFVEIGDQGHGFAMATLCGTRITLGFLDDPTVAPDTSCADDQSVDFRTG